MTTDTKPPKLMYTIPSLAEAAEISVSSVYKEIKDGNIVAKKYGKRTLIEFDEAKRFFAALPERDDAQRAS